VQSCTLVSALNTVTKYNPLLARRFAHTVAWLYSCGISTSFQLRPILSDQPTKKTPLVGVVYTHYSIYIALQLIDSHLRLSLTFYHPSRYWSLSPFITTYTATLMWYIRI